MSALADRIAKAIAALRAAGHTVDVLPNATQVYRVDGGALVTGPELLALAIRIGAMDGTSGAR